MLKETSEAFGIYIHYPYCLQRCLYCDFATYVQGTTISEKEYLDLLLKEIETWSHLFAPRKLTSLYLGGGTPSLATLGFYKEVFEVLRKHGFSWSESTEITLEINPATLDPQKIAKWLELGVNRFSVGVQTFEDDFLRKLGRKHSSHDTKNTLELLQSFRVSISMDLLYALPGQTLSQVQDEVNRFLDWSPGHISPYILTIPDTNPLSAGRPSNDIQADMYEWID